METEKLPLERVERGGKQWLALCLWEGAEIPRYKRDLLREGVCDALLPVSFCARDGREEILYDISGLQPLSRSALTAGHTLQMLGWLKSLSDGLRTAEDHLFSTEDFPLSAETVFVRPSAEGAQARLLFWPEKRPGRAAEKLAGLLRETERDCNDPEWRLCALSLRRRLEEEELGLREFSRLLEMEERTRRHASLAEERRPAEEARPEPERAERKRSLLSRIKSKKKNRRG